jgi:putative ABC transport system permease protein
VTEVKFLLVALKNLARRPLRTGLTVLSITVGIAMLFSFMSFSAGYQAGLREDLDRTGAHMLAVAKGCPYEATAMILHGGVVDDYLTTDDVARISQMPYVSNAVGVFMNQKLLDHGKTLPIMGLDEAGLALKPWWVIQGQRFVDDRSIILPAAMAAELKVSLGSEFHLPDTGEVFRVTGLLQKTGSQDDQFVYLPIATAQRLFAAEGKVTSVAIQLTDIRQIQKVAESVEELPDVQAITMSQVLGTVQTLMNSAQALITSMVVIAVLISGLGVMNSILMSVFERTRELGMMKSVGAGAEDVFILVWLESITLTALGGLLGVFAALTAGGLAERSLRALLPFAPSGDLTAFDWSMVATSITVALLLGIVAGAYPAYRAAQLSPMEAIRSE